MFELSKKQIKISYWFVTHKTQLKKILIVFLIVLNIGLWSYGIYNWILYFLTAKDHEILIKELIQEKINWPEYRLKTRPQDLIFSEITVLPSGKGYYDFVVEAENPNSKWVVLNLNYRFKWPNHQSKTQKNSFLPQEKKFLITSRASSSILPQSSQIEFFNIQWKKITPHFKIPKIDKSEFPTKNVQLLRRSEILNLDRIRFEVTNQTIYSFWEITFKIVLYQGQKIVGINQITANQFFSKETRLLETSWTEPIPLVTKIIIEPEVNILDPSSFMPPRGRGEPK